MADKKPPIPKKKPRIPTADKKPPIPRKKPSTSKVTPYPTMGDSVTEYLEKVEQWKKDNPLAAEKLGQQQEKNRKEYDIQKLRRKK